MIRLALIIILSAGVFVFAENTYTIQWVWPANDNAAEIQAKYPWMHMAPERVNIDISLDARSTWHELARGVPSTYGTNTWQFRLPDSIAYMGDATVRVSSIPMYRQAQVMQHVDLQIRGIRFISPPIAVTNGTQVTLNWVAAGAGDYVGFGTRVSGAALFESQALFASSDSNTGGITNSAIWLVDSLTPGHADLVLQSMEDPMCYRIYTLEVVNE